MFRKMLQFLHNKLLYELGEAGITVIPSWHTVRCKSLDTVHLKSWDLKVNNYFSEGFARLIFKLNVTSWCFPVV